MSSGTFGVEETTIEEVHAAYRSGELTCRALVEAYLERIEAYDRSGPELNAIATVNPGALEDADALDRSFRETGEFTGSLHGVPVLVKDQAGTAGIRTTYGSVAFEEYIPEEDATAVKRLKEAGAVILAKTLLPDFATSWFAYSSAHGEAKNPYALDRDPGGSSSGTGAGIAANLGLAGIGEDTGGSIRLPASFDNLVGVRVTTGLISRSGMSPLVVFQDTGGPMTRTVKDAAFLLDVLVGYDPEDTFTAASLMAKEAGGYASNLSDNAISGAKIGILRQAFGPDNDPDSGEVNRVVGEAIKAMSEAGAEIIDPVEVSELERLIGDTSLYLSQSRYDIEKFLSKRPGGHTVQSLHDSASYHPRLDLFEAIAREAPEDPEEDPNYFKGLAAREEFRRAILNTMASHGLDAIAFPTTQILPPTREELDNVKWTVLTFPTNTLIAAQSDLPSVSMPAGFSRGGLPVGLEIVGRPYGEAALLGLAHSFEKATDYRRSPAVAPPL